MTHWQRDVPGSFEEPRETVLERGLPVLAAGLVIWTLLSAVALMAVAFWAGRVL